MTRVVKAHGKLIEVEELDVGTKPSKAHKREAEAFVIVPLKWIATVKRRTRSQRAVVVGLLLHYLSWQAKGAPFECPNAIFERHGVDRKEKHLALLDLETSGLIAVERRGRRVPIITLLNPIP